MKITLDVHDFVFHFRRVRPDQFSREALGALFAWYEEMNQDMEFDPVSICCDWSEYETAIEAAKAYGWAAPDDGGDEYTDADNDKARDWLRDQTTVLETSCGVVVLNS